MLKAEPEKTNMHRRAFLQYTAAASVIALLPDNLRAAAPLSKFDEDSTAEEVTAGMDLSGRTYAITGANSGLGFETMRVLNLRGARVIGIARTPEKAQAAYSVGGPAVDGLGGADRGLPDHLGLRQQPVSPTDHQATR